jgi:excinuclease ABC A subunit
MSDSVNETSIEVIGADANNLKNVDVAFPLKGISVVTGVSGSGKSSLLSDTLAAEGSRRMRIFLGTSQQELERSDVRAFIGKLPPTILVGQRGFRPSVRTTVGTATGFLGVLRRLYVLASNPYSERAGKDVPPPSPDSYAGWLSRHYRGPAEIWAAPVRNHRTDGLAAVKCLASHGIEEIIVRSETDPPRLRESGRAIRASEFKGLNANVRHTIEALVGRVEVSGPQHAKELRDLLDRAFRAGNGFVVVSLPTAVDHDLAGPFGPRLDSTKHWVHPAAAEVFSGPSLHLLSFNAPEHEESGACRSCGGTGIGRRLREKVLVAYPGRSMRDGALAIWTAKNYKYVNVQHETIEGLRGMRGFSPDVPWSKLPASARSLVFDGSGDELVFDRDEKGRKFGEARRFAGFRKVIFEKSAAGTKAADQLASYVETGTCEACGGTRWSFQARALRVGGHTIAEILSMTFSEVKEFAREKGEFARAVPAGARSLVEAIRRHAQSIASVGLSYLTGDRGMLDVSDGESRRIRLARVLDAGEKGICLLLDEPARGLHESELSRLAMALERLRGNHTVIMNEHREGLWEAADWLIEVGEGAGSLGGEITYAGPRRKRSWNDDVALREPLPLDAKQPKIIIRGASIHNVRNVDCEIPLGRLTCICGVSGSGKSSFLRGVLAPALLGALGGVVSDFSIAQGRWRSVTGIPPDGEVVALDQAMPTPNRRSLVATFSGMFDGIRKAFGASDAARSEGLSASDFGLNAGHGRCSICLGVGEVEDGDAWSVCPACGGARYGHAALSVRVAGVNVQELLETPADRLEGVAEAFGISRELTSAMCDLGIGYVALGRRIDTLSGGEVQRLRLAMRLGAVSPKPMLFILDEPAVGLHPKDVLLLARALERILEGGRNTIVMVEHDLPLVRSSDWILEFGPESGPKGGRIVFAGTARQLKGAKTATGQALVGKLPNVKDSPELRKATGTNRRLPVDEQVARTTALLRTLISGDAAAAPESEDGSAEPVVLVCERFWSDRNSWEVAGLDLEIPKMLLDVERAKNRDLFAELLAMWKKDPECWLAVQPFLTDMQVWGTELPESVMRAVAMHVSKEGLQLVTTKGEAVGKDFDPRHVRARGRRFVPGDQTEEAKQRVLRDAFAVGARYVELRDSGGGLWATASDRLLNLDTPLIAPMVPVPSHFSRMDPRGRCPMCNGTRSVTSIADSLVIGNRNTPPDGEAFLTPEANAIMKGIRHNELKPFLRRLATEGLWDLKTSFERLDRANRNLILFGFWSRPGAGSFLKSPGADPAEVASWLRWDGLYRHVLDQADRSEDTDWALRIRETARLQRCPLCDGSGLQRFAALLRVGGVSYVEWTLLSDPGKKIDYLKKVEPLTPRQRRTRQRLLYCLAPLDRKLNSTESAEVVKRAVESFTTMNSAESNSTGPG